MTLKSQLRGQRTFFKKIQMKRQIFLFLVQNDSIINMKNNLRSKWNLFLSILVMFVQLIFKIILFFQTNLAIFKNWLWKMNVHQWSQLSNHVHKDNYKTVEIHKWENKKDKCLYSEIMVLFSDIQLFSLEYKFLLNILIKFHNANQKKKIQKKLTTVAIIYSGWRNVIWNVAGIGTMKFSINASWCTWKNNIKI